MARAVSSCQSLLFRTNSDRASNSVALSRLSRTVDLHLAVGNNLLDLALLLKVLEAPASERAVDLQSVDEGRDGHEAVGLDILVELVGSGLVEDDGVLGLVLDCGLRCSGQRAVMDGFEGASTLGEGVESSRSEGVAAARGGVGPTLSLGPLLLLLLSTSRGGSHFDRFLVVWMDVRSEGLAEAGGEFNFLLAEVRSAPGRLSCGLG